MLKEGGIYVPEPVAPPKLEPYFGVKVARVIPPSGENPFPTITYDELNLFNYATPDDVRKVLEDAARLVKKGWVQHQSEMIVVGSFRTVHHYCMTGAVGRAIKLNFDSTNVAVLAGARGQVHATIKEWEASRGGFFPSPMMPMVISWNDHPSRKKKEVVKVLRNAAQRPLEVIYRPKT